KALDESIKKAAEGCKVLVPQDRRSKKPSSSWSDRRTSSDQHFRDTWINGSARNTPE
ncbi:Hypothetical predicted protein, partial [Pelobates cultripes]